MAILTFIFGAFFGLLAYIAKNGKCRERWRALKLVRFNAASTRPLAVRD